MFSITMYDSETRVYLDPPLKNISELQLLDCNIKTKKVINFKNIESIFKVRPRDYIVFPPGIYTLSKIQSIFLSDPDSQKITIIETDTFDYLFSNKNFNVNISMGLQVGLGLPEVINPNKLYPINIQIKEPFRLMCSIVDNKSSYINNNTKYDELVKLTPSNLLANIPSKDYPTIPVRKYDTLINHFDLTILDAEWKKIDLKDSPTTISLRFK